MTMTPEDIEGLNKTSVAGSRRRLDELLPDNDWQRTSTSTNDTVLAAQRAAVWVQYLAFLFAGAGILFGIILMAQKDKYNETNPYVGAGIGVAVNAVVLAIILYAMG